jgi:hypothetical protein
MTDVTLTEVQKQLMRVGVDFTLVENWVGDVPRTPVLDPNRIRSVRLPFTPDDWWQLTTREGDDYIGPCCGTTGVMQDILCGAYRDGGWIGSEHFIELGQLAISHGDGFEDWGKPLSESGVKAAVADWENLERWDRLGVVYRAFKTSLEPKGLHKLRTPEPVPTEHDHISALFAGLGVLRYSDLFAKDEDSGQHRATTMLYVARLVPAMRMLLPMFQAYEPFIGFAIVADEEPDSVLDNSLGLCVYSTVKDAQEIIDISTKNDPKFKTRIRPVRISVPEGLTFMD